MRVCFMGQHVCALGYGMAKLQLPPVPEPQPAPRLENDAAIVRYRPKRNAKAQGGEQPAPDRLAS